MTGRATLIQVRQWFDHSLVRFVLDGRSRIPGMAEYAEIPEGVLGVPGAAGIHLLLALNFMAVFTR